MWLCEPVAKRSLTCPHLIQFTHSLTPHSPPKSPHFTPTNPRFPMRNHKNKHPISLDFFILTKSPQFPYCPPNCVYMPKDTLALNRNSTQGATDQFNYNSLAICAAIAFPRARKACTVYIVSASNSCLYDIYYIVYIWSPLRRRPNRFEYSYYTTQYQRPRGANRKRVPRGWCGFW